MYAEIQHIPETTREYAETTTTRARADGGKGGGGSCPPDENAKTDIDEYLEFGVKWGGKNGTHPDIPAAWAATVKKRLLAEGLTPVDQAQLAAWRQRSAQAEAKAAEALAKEEALAEEEAARLDRLYESLPADERQIVDGEVDASPPGANDIAQKFWRLGRSDRRREVMRERERTSAPPSPNPDSGVQESAEVETATEPPDPVGDDRVQAQVASVAGSLAAPWPCRPRRPRGEARESVEARERARRAELQAQARQMGVA